MFWRLKAPCKLSGKTDFLSVQNPLFLLELHMVEGLNFKASTFLWLFSKVKGREMSDGLRLKSRLLQIVDTQRRKLGVVFWKLFEHIKGIFVTTSLQIQSFEDCGCWTSKRRFHKQHGSVEWKRWLDILYYLTPVQVHSFRVASSSLWLMFLRGICTCWSLPWNQDLEKHNACAAEMTSSECMCSWPFNGAQVKMSDAHVYLSLRSMRMHLHSFVLHCSQRRDLQ